MVLFWLALSGGKEKEQTILDEFLDFFSAVLYGNLPEENVSDEMKNILTSESMMTALNSKVSHRMKQYSQTIDDSIVAKQNITIDCGTDKLTEWHLTPMVKEYTLYGKEVPGSGCIKYGCCYDVTQSSQIKLSSISDDKKFTKNSIKLIYSMPQISYLLVNELLLILHLPYKKYPET